MRVFTLFSFFILFSCGIAQKSNNQVTYNGILYVGTDSRFTSSSLNFLDLESGISNKILGDQSGDFLLLHDGQNVFAVNRKAESNNFRELKIIKKSQNDETTFNLQLGEQIKMPGEPIGGPHDVFVPENNIAIFLNYDAHKIDVVEISTGKLLQSLGSEFKTPGGVAIRPEKVIKMAENKYYILHQGYSEDYSSLHHGALFELNWVNKKLIPVDSDTKVPGIQGYELNSHTPQDFFKIDDTIAVIGMCWFGRCDQSFDVFDLKTKEVSSHDLGNLTEWVAYSTEFKKKNSEIIGIALAKNVTDGVNLIGFDANSGEVTKIFQFQDINGDQYADAGFFIVDSDDLYIGVPETENSGSIRLIRDLKVTDTYSLDSIPSYGIKILNGNFQ